MCLLNSKVAMREKKKSKHNVLFVYIGGFYEDKEEDS